MNTESKLQIHGHQLSLTDVLAVRRFGRRVRLNDASRFRARLERSRNIVRKALTAGKVVTA
jgi:histidine ammonia-lyase